MMVLVMTLGPSWLLLSSFLSCGSPLVNGRLPMLAFMVEKARSISSWEKEYSPMIHRATRMTRWDLMSSKISHIFWTMFSLCSGWSSMTSLMKRMVSREVKVDLLSNMRKESSKGRMKAGIVSGYVCVSCEIDFISRYRYSLVVEFWSPCSSIFLALTISFSRNAMISLMFLGEASSVASSRTFWLISREEMASSLMRLRMSEM
mmetsp:Transcript_15333/g.14919  ORF Transcript_15333/g.14919 Transcript_15333/m.14919 type:complete len:204 (+) Transcript_15333:112-723(+)